MVVDDDDTDVEFLSRELTKAGVGSTILHTKDASEGLKILRTAAWKPSIVILDINLPGMTGVTFLNKLREDSELNKTIVFALSSSDDPEDISALYEKNISAYLTKSQSLAGVARLISAYLEAVELPFP